MVQAFQGCRSKSIPCGRFVKLQLGRRRCELREEEGDFFDGMQAEFTKRIANQVQVVLTRHERSMLIVGSRNDKDPHLSRLGSCNLDRQLDDIPTITPRLIRLSIQKDQDDPSRDMGERDIRVLADEGLFRGRHCESEVVAHDVAKRAAESDVGRRRTETKRRLRDRRAVLCQVRPILPVVERLDLALLLLDLGQPCIVRSVVGFSLSAQAESALYRFITL
jgi:hypothetical protein